MPTFRDYKDRSWTTQPAAEALLREVLARAMAACPALAAFADRIRDQAGIRLRDILDHLVLSPELADDLAQAGWAVTEHGIWRHSDGYFPDVLLAAGDTVIAFRCESVADVLARNGVSAEIEGQPFGPLRRADLAHGGGVVLRAVERNGYVGYDLPEVPDALIRAGRLHAQAFRARRRQFDSVKQGLDHTEALVDAAVADLGAHWACDVWLRAERDYWMARCPAGQLQKARQDQVGLGWCNIDHHTYDSSRAHFRQTIRILEKLGYEMREMLYAGAMAGWGSQILEQPVLRSTIFADVDLAPEEVDIDFAHDALAPLDKHRRCGLWVAIHGESMLDAGLNHVAGMYDQTLLRDQLSAIGLRMMQPFSNFPFLYQELTEGNRLPVEPARIDALLAGGHIGAQEAEDFRLNGVIALHLENLERNDGYKGFNKPGIDGVLRAIDPRVNRAEA
jgi:hypothetical protein